MVLVKPPTAPPPPPPEEKPPHAEPDLSKYPRNDMYVTTAATRTVATGAALAYLLVSHWGFKTIFHTVFTRPTHWFGRLFKHFMPNPAKLERQLEQDVGGYMSHLFAVNSPHVARWMHEQADVIEQATGVIMAEAEWTYQALRSLRWTTVPTLIYRATLPLATAINKLDARLSDVETKIANATGYVNANLRRLPWGTGATFDVAMRQFSGAFVHLWNDYYNFTKGSVQWLVNVGFPALSDEVQRIYDDLYNTGRDSLTSLRTSVHALELEVGKIINDPTAWVLAALGTAAGIIGFQTLLRTAAPNLTCDNTRTFTEELCASPAGTGAAWAAELAELAALLVAFGLVLDPKLVLRLGQEAESGIDWAFREMAGV